MDTPQDSRKHTDPHGDRADRADDATPDTDSDPAHSDEQGLDWSNEGGATPEGPATDTDDV